MTDLLEEPALRTQGSRWERAVSLERLQRDGRAVVKAGGKQIALFLVGGEVLACNNRCPHEGYPLREGTLDGACILTCNWHNWKFDLKTGANLYGGDRLRLYPTRLEAGEVWVDVADPTAAERQARALENLRAAVADHEYDRIARELARLEKAGGDPTAAVAQAILWSHDRLEFGMTHAYAAAEAWLRVHDTERDPEARIACLVEAIAGIAWDVLREPPHPYPDGVRPWDERRFLAAIEAQDEAAAIGHIRGALGERMGFPDLEHALTRAALAHYADFGHSLIYVVHAGRLIGRLGGAVAAPLLLALTRSLAYASREDLIPEFRHYAVALGRWPQRHGDGAAPDFRSLAGMATNQLLDTIVAAAGESAPERLYPALLGAAATNLLQFDTAWEARTESTIAQNVGWLDFTHGITFANALRRQAVKFPELWPAGLLQLACFIGRASEFTLAEDQLPRWRVADRAGFAAAAAARIVDHGEDRYILAQHLVKTFLAAMEESAAEEVGETVLAATNRFLSTPPKRKHVRRTAHQAKEFVALED